MSIHRVLRLGFFAIAIGLLVAIVFAPPVGQGELDFIAYWSGARLLVQGKNPYDPVALRALEHELRPARSQDNGEPFASWNPPWLLVILLPMGLLPFDVATPVWMLCNMGLISVASALAWRLLCGPPERRGVLAALAAMSLWTGPSLATILVGQVSSLVLVGLVLCAWFLCTGHDELAGAAICLAAIKPHMVYFVLLLLVLWAIRHRRWRILVGMAAAALVAAAVLWLMFPGWVQAYVRLMLSYRSLLFLYPTPTVGSLAYALLGTNWLRFAGILLLPLVPAMLRLADREGWLTAMNVALLFSVPLAMYGFSLDQVILIPAGLQVVSWLWRRELPKRWAGAIAAGLVLEYLICLGPLLIQAKYASWFILAPLALAGLYALAWRQRTAPPRPSSGAPVEKSA